MINYKKYHPVRTLTFKGKLLVGTVRFLYRIRKLLGFPQWDSALPNHHEDPLHTNTAENLYLGYKYYYKALVKPETNSGLENYFANQSLAIDLPENFIADHTISLSVGGDLIPYENITKEKCTNLWDEAGDFFFNNDLVFANLESPADLSKPYSAAPEVMLNDMFFNIDQETFTIFSGNGKYKGYDVLSTANNHTMDMGVDGIFSTQDFLTSRDIRYTGTASSKETRDNFPIIEKKGIKVAFLSYTYSLNKETLPQEQEWLCNHLNLNEENADISLIVHHADLARQRGADIIVAALHMGCAYQAYPSRHIVDNMHRICDKTGIDILIGGHPHNAQPMEIYTTSGPSPKQHLIVYSLGDFIAYDIYKWCHLPLILRLEITKGNVDGKVVTILSRIQAKPFYMYMDRNGMLQLKDFMKLSGNATVRIPEEAIATEIKELTDFFEQFIVTKTQAHILI